MLVSVSIRISYFLLVSTMLILFPFPLRIQSLTLMLNPTNHDSDTYIGLRGGVFPSHPPHTPPPSLRSFRRCRKNFSSPSSILIQTRISSGGNHIMRTCGLWRKNLFIKVISIFTKKYCKSSLENMCIRKHVYLENTCI